MKIAVIGARGRAGSLIAEEAKRRGHEVTGFVRSGEPRAGIIVKDLFALTADDLRAFDAVVNAIGTFGKNDSHQSHIEAAKYLIGVFAALPDVRLFTIGGAGSLYTDESKTTRIVDNIPAGFNALPMAATVALDEFRKSDINWTFVSPAGIFDPNGPRSGEYTLGGDVQILNRVGQSYISYADFAIAMVDEIETGKFVRQRFTAVSCDKYFRNMPQYFPVSKYMFSRAGAWLALTIDNTKYGTGALNLSTNRGMRTHGRAPGKNLYRIYPTFEGKRVAFATQSTPAELILHTLYGDVRFTWADSNKLMANGDKGMGLQWTRTADAYELIKERKGGAWESDVRAANPLLFVGLEGSRFVFDRSYNWYKLNSGEICGRTVERPEGGFTMVCDETPYGSKAGKTYPTYAEAKADMQNAWESFLNRLPHFCAPYEKKREETAYVLWTHLVGPTALTPNWMMLMFPGEMDSQWQLVQNAVALQDVPELLHDLLLAPLLRQDADGQLAEGYDEAYLSTGSVKPPIFGWALKNIMARHDLLREWKREDVELLYERAGKWADWFMEYRDDDEDGLPGFFGGNENGFDEVTTYWDTNNLATPDLCAQEVLNFEAQGDLARLLGKPQEEIDAWYRKSKELLDRMIDRMWDGEHFVALRQYTHEPIFAGSNLHYIPFVLGNRLPQEIIDKMAADLSVEGKLLCDYGLASENLDSDVYEVTGVKMGCGVISPPGELFILSGMWEAGQKELAGMIIGRYLNRLITRGFSHFIDPIHGDGSAFCGTWCRAVYSILARMVSEG